MNWLQKSILMTSSALTLALPTAQFDAYAATANSNPPVRAELNGTAYPAIAVGDVTYVLWRALQVFKTPYEYLGNGKFAVTGGTVQGVVYKGDTYLPWNVVAAKVKATSLRGGGFNFTSVPVNHQYHIEIEASNVPAGSPAPLFVAVLDGDNGIPHQSIHIHLTGSSHVSGFTNGTDVFDYTYSDGTSLYSINDKTQETVHPEVSWTDPSGVVHTVSADLTFTTPSQTTTPTPSDDRVVATVPITTFNNAVLFNAQANETDIPFQLDTGAYAMLVTKQIANLLHLPNLGDVPLEGVGGQDEGYMSQISFSLGGVEFDNVPCFVDNNYEGTPLFGYKFFVDNGYDLLISQKHNTLTILK